MEMQLVKVTKLNMALVRYESPRTFDPEGFLLAMFLMFARAPRKTEPEVDGSYSLGEIGQDAFEGQRLLRDTPYSVCRGIRGDSR
jgi:hypothetical protein